MNKCTVCQRPDVAEINRLLLAGSSLRELEKTYGLSRSSLERHKVNHAGHPTGTSNRDIQPRQVNPDGRDISDLIGRQAKPKEKAETAEELNRRMYLEDWARLCELRPESERIRWPSPVQPRWRN